MIADALKLSVYFGESVEAQGRLASDALIACFERRGLLSATLLRGIEGFGINRRIHAQRFPDVSTDLPLLAVAVDEHDRIRAALDDVDRIVPRGLVTLERARLATGRDVAGADFPPGPGRAAKLTIYCGAGERAGARPAYREAVALLRRHGATGAIVLPGVDGLLDGRRQRQRLFGPNGGAPLIIISVGPADLLRPSLRHLGGVLAEPVVTLEGIAQVKHDGELLEPPPTVDPGLREQDVWQAIRVYTRRVAEVNGRALYSELTRRLREVGGAGATTILGDWGFSSDEPPHGDKLGRVASHRPTYTVYIDRAEKVAEVWPVIDELTARHGIVTSLLVPAYRERAGETVHGSLDVAEDAVARWAQPGADVRAPALEPSAGAVSPWLADLLERIDRFARDRGGRPPVVRVTLADGERFFLYAIEAGPGDDCLTLHPHPERYEEMVDAGGTRLPPRALVVPQASILKIELLTKPPRGTRSLVALRRTAPR
jgi:PII-like signaling protein